MESAQRGFRTIGHQEKVTAGHWDMSGKRSDLTWRCSRPVAANEAAFDQWHNYTPLQSPPWSISIHTYYLGPGRTWTCAGRVLCVSIQNFTSAYERVYGDAGHGTAQD